MKETFQEFKEELKKKRIAVIGAGVSNIPLLTILVELGSNVTLFDQKELTEMPEIIQNLIQTGKINFFLGENYLENLIGFEIIFRSPSFLPTNEYLMKEKEKGAYITTEVEQVIRFAPGKVIGVTGSKGKTTTTTIIYNLLKELGYSVYLGGNIGTPLFSKIEKMKEKDIVILELSSFQLMEMKVSPDIAVITNISPDHLDIHGSYEEYIEAKKYLFRNQSKEDILVLNEKDPIVRDFQKEARGEVRLFGSKQSKNSYYVNQHNICYNGNIVVDTSNLLLKGDHNYLNICAALSAIYDYLPKDYEKITTILNKIQSVAHRLEFVREINGIKWYNDSASTTPDKSIAGIYAFDNDIVLIAGGYDKNISYKPLAKPILEKVSKLILFGNTKNKIYEAVMKEKKEENNSNLQIYVMDTLEEVVEAANRVSSPGEVVLFSPASASFDMFKNAYQRGDLFKELVLQIRD